MTLSLALGVGAAGAQDAPAPDPRGNLKMETPEQSAEPDPMKETVAGVTIVPHLGDKVPADAWFFDEMGKRVTIGDYLKQGRPVILTLNYYRCPMLCGLVMNGAAHAVKALPLEPGTDYQIVTVGIDPAEPPSMARAKKQRYLTQLEKPGFDEGWAFLTGETPQIDRVAEAVGFQYRWVEEERQYAHPAAVIVLTPDGTIARYLFPTANDADGGVARSDAFNYDVDTMRLSLVEASEGHIGTIVDQLLLTCFHFDPNTGKYSRDAMFIMRMGGVFTVGLIVSVLGLLFLRERRQRRDEPETPATSG